MKKLNVNAWMEMDMIGDLYFVVYANSPDEWWILAKAETYAEALPKLANEMLDADGDEDKYFIINFEGERVTE